MLVVVRMRKGQKWVQALWGDGQQQQPRSGSGPLTLPRGRHQSRRLLAPTELRSKPQPVLLRGADGARLQVAHPHTRPQPRPPLNSGTRPGVGGGERARHLWVRARRTPGYEPGGRPGWRRWSGSRCGASVSSFGEFRAFWSLGCWAKVEAVVELWMQCPRCPPPPWPPGWPFPLSPWANHINSAGFKCGLISA